MKYYYLKAIYLLICHIVYFTVYKIIVNINKTLIVDFFPPKSSLGTHTVHGLSLRLRTPLVAVLHLRLKSLKTTCEKNYLI